MGEAESSHAASSLHQPKPSVAGRMSRCAVAAASWRAPAPAPAFPEAPGPPRPAEGAGRSGVNKPSGTRAEKLRSVTSACAVLLSLEEGRDLLRRAARHRPALKAVSSPPPPSVLRPPPRPGDLRLAPPGNLCPRPAPPRPPLVGQGPA